MFDILVQEGNPSLQKLYSSVLRTNGFEPLISATEKETHDALMNSHVDLIIIDAQSVISGGSHIIETIKADDGDIPVIIISSDSSQEEKRKCFTAGVDDYMIKPIDEEELIFRIKAILRRLKTVSERKITIGSTTLYYDSLMVDVNGSRQYLPKKEFYLLYKLCAYPEQIFTKTQLLDEIWGFESDSDNTLNVHVSRLRSRFESCPDFSIDTVRGVGYRMIRKK